MKNRLGLIVATLAILLLALVVIKGRWVTEGRDDRTESGNVTHVSDGTCRNVHPGGVPPFVPDRILKESTPLCGRSFLVLYGRSTGTPIWVSQHLTRGSIAAARRIERVDRFASDDRLPSRSRPRVSDYEGSGWDRGHLAPSADMPDEESQDMSFLLSNIAPQAPRLNRGGWAELESSVRSEATRSGSVYVVTGVTFDKPRSAGRIGRFTMIPDRFWKAVLSPGNGSVAYLAENRNGAVPVAMPLQTFRAATGIDPFPAMDAEDRTTTIDLDRRRSRKWKR